MMKMMMVIVMTKMVKTHRIPGNKVFVPAGVVENEGKHAVHKNLGGGFSCPGIKLVMVATKNPKSSPF